MAMLPYAGVALGTRALFFDDHLRFDVPMTELINQDLCSGHLPLWNPYLGVGTPLITDAGALPVYPGRLLGCGLPPAHALGLLLVLQLGVLAAGATVLLRELGVRSALAVGGGAALALAGPAPSWLTGAPFLVSLSFFPWILLWARRLGRGQGRAALGLGASIGLATLGGDVPGTLFAAGTGLLIWLGACRERRRQATPVAPWRSDLLLLVGAAGLALLIGAGSWVPLSWFLQRSARAAGIPAVEAGQWSLSPSDLLGLWLPNPRGLPLPEFTFWPFRAMGTERLFVHSLYVGATLAGFGVWGCWHERRDAFVRWAAVAAVALLVLATGAETPLWVVTHGIFTYFRYPSKLAPYAVILVGVVGVSALSRALADARRLALVAVVVAGVCGLGVLWGPAIQRYFAARAAAPDDVIRRAGEALRFGSARAAAIALAFVAFALWHRLRRRFDARMLAAALAGLLVLDAALAGVALNWTAPAAPMPRPDWLPEARPWGTRVMRSQVLDENRLGLDSEAYRAEQQRHLAELLPVANLSQRVGALVSHHTGALFGYGQELADPAQRIAAAYDTDGVALAEATGCDLALAPRSRRLRWAAQGMAAGRLTLTRLLPDAAVLSVTRKLPRAFLTTGARIVAPGGETAALAAAQDGPAVIITAGEALVRGRRETFAAPPGDALLAGPGGEIVEVRPLAWRAERVLFQLAAPGPRLFVLLDAFADGWRASLDGDERPILRVNSVGRGIVVPAGAHTLEMRFQPLALTLSPWISWLSLLATGMATLLVACRRRGKMG